VSNHLPDLALVEPYTHQFAVSIAVGDSSNANMQAYDCRVMYDDDRERSPFAIICPCLGNISVCDLDPRPAGAPCDCECNSTK
jgi:hypothetical protein